MKRSTRSPVVAAAFALIAFGCDSTVPTTPDRPDAGPSLAAAAGASLTTSPIRLFPMEPVTFVDGSSTITRNRNGATMTLHATNLTPGSAYTVWAVVFNEPEGCIDGCDEGDLFNPDAVTDVLYVAGNIAGGPGTSTFSGLRAAGDNSVSLFAALGVPAPGLVDPLGAEVHLIVRDHGPKVPGLVPAQIHSFEGGCTPASSFDLGTGTYACMDIQFSIHNPS